jgi:hypothetical protein
VIDRLPEQRDLQHALIGEPLALLDDVCRRAVDLCPARKGHDAVRTELVAPARDPDVRAPAERADRVDRADRTREIEVFE